MNKLSSEFYEKDNDYDSRWADHYDFIKSLKRINLNSEEIYTQGGVPLACENGNIYVDVSDNHSLILGSTGSKKSRLIAMPTLQILTRCGESFVVTDPKQELYDSTYPLLKKYGYNILVVNLRNPSRGNSWNPLSFPYELYKSNFSENKDKARELLDDLAHNIFPGDKVDDPFWENSAQDFFLGLTEILFRNAGDSSEINLRSVNLLKAQTMVGDENKLLSSEYYKNIDKNSFEYSCLAGTVEAPEKTRTSILSVFNQYMRIFAAQDALVEMLSSNDIDFNELGTQKTALFLIVPDEKTTYHRLVSIFIKQCYEHLILQAQKLEKASLPIRVNFVLDEFSSLPRISDFPAMITAARSRNIRFNLFIQSEHQLQARYGDEAETIKSNCNNWLFLTSRELPLLKEISELSGKKQRDIPLISVSALQRLNKDKGEVLVFHGRLYPHVSLLEDISNYPKYSEEVVMVDRPHYEIKNFDFFGIDKKMKESIDNQKNFSVSFLKDLERKQFTDEEIVEIIKSQSTDVFLSEIENEYDCGDVEPYRFGPRKKKINENVTINIVKLCLISNSTFENEFVVKILFNFIFSFGINEEINKALKKVPEKLIHNFLNKYINLSIKDKNFKNLILINKNFSKKNILISVEDNLDKYFLMKSILTILDSKKSEEQIKEKIFKLLH